MANKYRKNPSLFASKDDYDYIIDTEPNKELQIKRNEAEARRLNELEKAVEDALKSRHFNNVEDKIDKQITLLKHMQEDYGSDEEIERQLSKLRKLKNQLKKKRYGEED